MKLFSRVHGSGRPLVILHGVFGSADNWLTLGKRFAEDYEVHLIDQRNHGQSPHSEEFSYPAMVSLVNQVYFIVL
ncbi:MAG: alpha/beta fold hydrolase, partial [Bacteroidota bacterium]